MATDRRAALAHPRIKTIESRPPDTANTSRRPAAARRSDDSIRRPRSSTAISGGEIARAVTHSKVARPDSRRLCFCTYTAPGALVESQGPLAILWVGLGLCCFYIALVWLNTLLGFFLTPLFLIPATWLMDRKKRRQAKAGEKSTTR
jgi:Flp pilus assembly protein TadB